MANENQLLVEMLRRMLRIRHFEERVIELVDLGEILGWVHPYVGEEAVAVGVCAALRDDDYIVGNHRSHGHPIAKGADLRRAMAELFGKATGYCKGKGGSMHLADFSVGILGESGIVGSSLPVGVGAGVACKLKKLDRVSACFFGDGASNQGTFHESINLASVWKLPVVFVCENNQFAQTTSYRTVVAAERISDRAVAYAIPGVHVDGMDVLAMHEAAKAAVERARAGEGPSLIEGLTYRYYDHSVAVRRIVRRPYRTEEELESWKQRDPIKRHKRYLLDHAIMSEGEIDNLEEEVKAQWRRRNGLHGRAPSPSPTLSSRTYMPTRYPSPVAGGV